MLRTGFLRRVGQGEGRAGRAELDGPAEEAGSKCLCSPGPPPPPGARPAAPAACFPPSLPHLRPPTAGLQRHRGAACQALSYPTLPAAGRSQHSPV